MSDQQLDVQAFMDDIVNTRNERDRLKAELDDANQEIANAVAQRRKYYVDAIMGLLGDVSREPLFSRSDREYIAQVMIAQSQGYFSRGETED